MYKRGSFQESLLSFFEKAILERKAATGKLPKAIVPVALYGMPYRIDEIMAIADKYGIPVVEANEAFIGC